MSPKKRKERRKEEKTSFFYIKPEIFLNVMKKLTHRSKNLIKHQAKPQQGTQLPNCLEPVIKGQS